MSKIKVFIEKHLADSCEDSYEAMCKEALSELETIYEIAFGDDAINRGFSHNELIETLRGFSENAYKYEELEK